MNQTALVHQNLSRSYEIDEVSPTTSQATLLGQDFSRQYEREALIQMHKCNPIGNYTDFFKWNATQEYEGIPENLFINTCGLMILLLIFFVLRISALKPIEAQKHKKATEKWKELFFSETAKDDKSISAADETGMSVS